MDPPSFPSFQHLHADDVSPRTRGDHMHEWYRYLAVRYREPGWMFMNVGYADPDPAAGEGDDNPLASCARLYTRVAEGLEPRGKRLLEVGCGRGGGAFAVMRRLKPASFHAIDRAEEAIALCRGFYSVPGLEFRQGEAESIPFPSGSFDGVLNVESSHCYGDFARFVGEVDRVLAPGGRFAIADIRPSGEIPAWRDLLLRTGLRLIEARDITANVLAALRRSHAFKLKYAAERVDAADRARFLEFAAAEGSWYFEQLRGDGMQYWQFLLQKGAAVALAL